MFKSATLKLTFWYLLILMGISLLFSVIIYQVASSEVRTRLESLQNGLTRGSSQETAASQDQRSLRAAQADKAAANLFFSLVYINAIILAAGGIGSYLLARRTIRPIEEAHDAQSRFTSDASHELRTPLAAMRTELEVALRDPSLSKQEMKELLESNLEEVNKLTELSKTLLQLSRLDHSGITKDRVSLAKITKGVSERFDKKGARINLVPSKKPLYIYAHEVSIEELVTILVDNAVKYSPAGSPIKLRLCKRNRRACLEVTNTGKGIGAEDLPHIFDRFYRVDSSRTSGPGAGYGLGLSLAKKIVELHRGELSASSAPDHETTFTVLLPLFTPKPARPHLPSRSSGHHTA